MSRRLRIFSRAIADLDHIVDWLKQRTPQGAAALVAAFEKAIATLGRFPEAYSIAPESDLLGTELRQVFFKTRKGNTYRMIVRVVADEIQVLRIRGPGQPPPTADELDLPHEA